jgi:hypothetical protein
MKKTAAYVKTTAKKPASFFGDMKPVEYRHYKPDRKVLGKRMEDQLRFAACYWHSFVWPGLDPFGGDTFQFTAGGKLDGAIDGGGGTGSTLTFSVTGLLSTLPLGLLTVAV